MIFFEIHKLMICYEVPTISTFNMLSNSWYCSLYTLKCIVHFRRAKSKSKE